MTLQEVMTKASEGGYQHEFPDHEPGLRAVIVGLHGFSIIQVNAIFLDPHFWYALGRTLGWHHEPVWQGPWQRFLDHLAHGNTPETFFATL